MYIVYCLLVVGSLVGRPTSCLFVSLPRCSLILSTRRQISYHITTLRSRLSLMKYECVCVLLCVFASPEWQVNVGHPSEVDEIFDAISYSKGASVIRMLHNYIGDEVRGRGGCGRRSIGGVYSFPTWMNSAVVSCFLAQLLIRNGLVQ